MAVLALAAAVVVVAGMKGYAAITGWVADVPAAVLTDLYVRSGAAPGPPPSKSTIWRVLTGTGPDAFDAAVGAWLTGLADVARQPTGVAGDSGSRLFMQVRLDGKILGLTS